MSTNDRQFPTTEIDEENGTLIGVDEDGYRTRVSRTDWVEQNKDAGNWESVIEALATDLSLEEQEDDEVSLTIDTETASKKLCSRHEEFISGESGELQARLVLEYLTDHDRFKMDDDELVMVDDVDQFPQGLINYAAYLTAFASELEETIDRARDRLEEIQERREELEEELGDPTTEIEEEELADKIIDICGEFKYPDDWSVAEEGKYMYDVTAPSDIEDESAREAFENIWAQLLEKQFEPGGFELREMNEFYNTLETDISLLEERMSDMRDAAIRARRLYLAKQQGDINTAGDKINIHEGLEITSRQKRVITEKTEALERDDLREAFQVYEQTPSVEPEETEDEMVPEDTSEDIPDDNINLSSDPDIGPL